jgi:hypothetical protein
MDNHLKDIGKEKLPSVIKDPFKKENINRIIIDFSANAFNEGWTANGWIYFKNGDTKGEQKVSGTDFNEVVLKIKAIIDEFSNEKL